MCNVITWKYEYLKALPGKGKQASTLAQSLLDYLPSAYSKYEAYHELSLSEWKALRWIDIYFSQCHTIWTMCICIHTLSFIITRQTLPVCFLFSPSHAKNVNARGWFLHNFRNLSHSFYAHTIAKQNDGALSFTCWLLCMHKIQRDSVPYPLGIRM